MPILSIITPAFQAAKYLPDCIQSVASEGIPSLEHLIVDGGSTDDTRSVLAEAASRYPHLRWISEKDNGQSDALNKGIRMAKGAWIGILNADDIYEPGILKRILQLVESEPQWDFISGNLIIRDLESGHINLVRPGPPDFRKLMLFDDYEFAYNPVAYFYQKILHEKIGYYDETDHLAMDYQFLILASTTARTRYLDETFGTFHHHETSKTVNDTSPYQTKNRSRDSALRKCPWYFRLYWCLWLRTEHERRPRISALTDPIHWLRVNLALGERLRGNSRPKRNAKLGE